MYMTRIRIRNFRGLEDIEFSPGTGVNLLTGPNAVGKTSILEAIRLTKHFLHLGIERRVVKSSFHLMQLLSTCFLEKDR